MTAWSHCPSCGLKHTARADGRCPRCAASVVDGDPGPAPAPAEGDRAAPPAARWAAFVLYANALAGIAALLALPATVPGRMSSVGPVIVDVIVASSLLRGSAGARGWALVRAVLGALVLGPILWSNAGPEFGLGQLLFSAGLVLILAGEAGPGRRAAGAVASATAMLAIVILVASPGAAARVRGAVADLMDRGAHLETLTGREGWALPLTPDRWHPRGRPPEGVEAVATWPEHGAVVMVTTKRLEGDVDLAASVDGILASMQEKGLALREHERRGVRVPHGRGVALRISAVEDGRPVEGWWVFAANGRRLGLVMTLAPAQRFEDASDELLTVASELDLTD